MESEKASWHLRVTVLPQCNERCRYCNPSGVFENSPRLSDDEILEIVAAAVECGINRIHWTGGEPCIRDVRKLFSEAKRLGMTQQIMTTNGSLRSNEVENLKLAGLDRVNVSLDSLDPEKNRLITGRTYFESKMQWIREACRVFDMETKMNIVPMVDNLAEVPAFIAFAQQFNGKLMLKFIELCPNNPAFYEEGIGGYAVSRQDIVNALQKVGALISTSGVGDNPNAEYYHVGSTGVRVILITMPSMNYKCGLERCLKLRVSPYGLAGSCIQQKGCNLRGLSFKGKVEIIRGLMAIREGYSNVPPVTRKHLRRDYGIWRFGNIRKGRTTCTDECSH